MLVVRKLAMTDLDDDLFVDELNLRVVKTVACVNGHPHRPSWAPALRDVVIEGLGVSQSRKSCLDRAKLLR